MVLLVEETLGAPPHSISARKLTSTVFLPKCQVLEWNGAVFGIETQGTGPAWLQGFHVQEVERLRENPWTGVDM